MDPISLTSDQQAVLREISDQVLRGLLDWLSYFEDTRFYTTAFIIGFLKVFNEPGLKKSELTLYLEVNAKVSRSTAERMLRDAEEAGHLQIEKRVGGNGLATFLSAGLFNHCVHYLTSRTKASLEHSAAPGLLDIE